MRNVQNTMVMLTVHNCPFVVRGNQCDYRKVQLLII